MDSYTVKAPLVVLPNPDGGPDRHMYAGTAVPADVDEATRDRLVNRGLFVANPATDGASLHDETPPGPGSLHDAPPVVETKPAAKRRRHHASDDQA